MESNCNEKLQPLLQSIEPLLLLLYIWGYNIFKEVKMDPTPNEDQSWLRKVVDYEKIKIGYKRCKRTPAIPQSKTSQVRLRKRKHKEPRHNGDQNWELDRVVYAGYFEILNNDTIAFDRIDLIHPNDLECLARKYTIFRLSLHPTHVNAVLRIRPTPRQRHRFNSSGRSTVTQYEAVVVFERQRKKDNAETVLIGRN
ncbi:hypothetical protein QE152_g22096 [Popillia japonica]|uniref:Uncharacterized protein n=1 Tax=Popillia japonica TaxID=7064 RepID=A0AAW1KLE8_POPJA